MSVTPPSAAERAPWPFFNPYALLCLGALGALALLETQRGLRFATPLVLLIGLTGVLTRMRSAPLLLLLAFAGGHFLEQYRLTGFDWEWAEWQWRGQSFRATDVALGAAMLGYVVGHYRLQAIANVVFPLDRRLREGSLHRPGRVVHVQRSPGLVTTDEIGWLILTLPVPALLGQLAYLTLARPWNVLGLPPQVGRMLLLLWVLGIGAFVVAALLNHWRSRRMSAAEGTLFLQETLWRETRGEQRLINRWVARAKLRSRKEES